MNGVGDFIAVSALALKLIQTYKDAPGEYNHISDEVKSLHSLIEGVQHLEMAALSCSQQQDGKEILQGCQNALEDLDEFIEKHKRLKINKVTRFKLGLKNMMGLRIRLISNTLLLFVFIQRFVGPNMVRKMRLTSSPLVALKVESKTPRLEWRILSRISSACCSKILSSQEVSTPERL